MPRSARFCFSCGASLAGEGLVTQTVATPSTPKSISRGSSSSLLDAGRFLPGAMLGDRYRIVAMLGRGGMGEVYRADDLSLGQPVALKFLPEAALRNEDALERFRNEVRMARQVSHPNVCRVYDLGEVGGHLFLSMEYVDGEDLGCLLRRIGRVPPDKALEIGRKLCAGLAAAHEKGVLHRDLKPGNVMLDGRGQVLITDFGLAGMANQIEGVEVRSGTPAYMAPEQLAGKEVTVRSDIYSLGLLLYEVFTGKRPFEADTLADLVQARSSTSPANPSTLVRELDPAVERVILRCLEPEPWQRPASALAVAAALPGGDPLAAALAAGETPSPQMVAAAGESTGLAPRIAIPCLAAVLVGLAAVIFFAHESSAFETHRLEYAPEVLRQKARDITQRLGYTGRPADTSSGFNYDGDLMRYVTGNDKPRPRWDEILEHGPPIISFWYRESPEPMIATDYTDDLLTPDIVTPNDPPAIQSGMIGVQLDPRGRLLSFEAVPAQKETAASSKTAAPDWTALFAAAGLDTRQLKPAEPQWTSLAMADARAAWTGTWPGTIRPLRVEAGALRGKPVFFSLIGPWNQPDRMQRFNASAGEKVRNILLLVLGIMVLFAAALLARHNHLRGRGDRKGAFRLASFMFCVQMALWLCRGHFVATPGLFLVFVLAISTSLFAGGLMFVLYLALEPYVRRHWPQTMISWSRVLAGRLRDPLAGRDVLFGVLLGIGWALIFRVRIHLMQARGAPPGLPSTDFLMGARRTLAATLIHIPYSVRGMLMMFFILFLFRVLLRKQWLAGLATVLLYTAIGVLGSDYPAIKIPALLLIYGIAILAVLRYGVVALAAGIFTADVVLNMPVTLDPSNWYFSSFLFVVLIVVALAAAAFQTAIAGRALWKEDFFG